MARMPEPEDITRANMHTVVVKKADLVKTVTENRDKHRTAYERAMEDYKVAALRLLEEHIQRIKDKAPERVQVVLEVPEDHTDDYDRVLLSWEMSIFDEVELSMTEFDQYVRDNWTWKQQFLRTSAMYNEVANAPRATR